MSQPRSEPSTAPGSPADSDEEDSEADVDYDDVRFPPPLYATRRLMEEDRFWRL